MTQTTHTHMQTSHVHTHTHHTQAHPPPPPPTHTHTSLHHGEELQEDSQEDRLEGNTAALRTPPSGAPLPAPGNHGEPWQSPPERTPS